jgi:transcriptional regulator
VGGTLRLHDDAAWVESLVRELSTSFEARREQPWSVDDAPADYVGALAKGIVGFDVEVTSITGAAKLSQNKGDVDRRGVRDGLEQGDRRSRDLAARMDVGP